MRGLLLPERGYRNGRSSRPSRDRERTAEQIEVADQIEHLVPGELVGEAQGGVHHFFVIDEDQVVEAGAAAEAHLRELAKLADEAEGSRGRDLARVRVGRSQFEVHLLDADRLRIVERVIDDQMVGGLDANKLAALALLTDENFVLIRIGSTDAA